MEFGEEDRVLYPMPPDCCCGFLKFRIERGALRLRAMSRGVAVEIFEVLGSAFSRGGKALCRDE